MTLDNHIVLLFHQGKEINATPGNNPGAAENVCIKSVSGKLVINQLRYEECMKDDQAGPFPKAGIRRDEFCKNKDGENEFNIEINIVEPVVGYLIFTHPKACDFGKQCVKNKHTKQLPPAGAGAQQPPHAGQQANEFKNDTWRKRHGLNFYGQRAPSSNTNEGSSTRVGAGEPGMASGK